MASKTLSFLFGALLVLSFVQNSPAQTGKPSEATSPGKQTEPQLLKGILDEMRELRTTLQQTSLLQYRSAFMLDRVRRQEARVKSAEGELRELRAAMRELTDPTRYDDLMEDINEVEVQINETVDMVERSVLGREVTRYKNKLERLKKADTDELELKRRREPKLEEQLRTEQAALVDLDYQVEALLRQMDLLVGTKQTSVLKPAP